MRSLATTLNACITRANRYRTAPWSGQPLLPHDGYLTFHVVHDAVGSANAIPNLAALTAWAGGDTIWHSDAVDCPRFIAAHRHLHWVAHRCAEPFWTVESHLRGDASCC
jgi:hypothetical protein